jgi:hypothetical protein
MPCRLYLATHHAWMEEPAAAAVIEEGGHFSMQLCCNLCPRVPAVTVTSLHALGGRHFAFWDALLSGFAFGIVKWIVGYHGK